MPNDSRPSRRPSPAARPDGKRFRTADSPAPAYTRSTYGQGSQRAPRPAASRAHGAAPARPVRRSAPARTHSPLLGVGIVVAVVAIVAALAFFVLPAVTESLFPSAPSVAAGQEVRVTIPEGASGDAIASELAGAHVIENPKDYYAAVERLDAAQSIKPGEYLFVTGQDPEEVVRQLVEGPNVEGKKLVIQEGLTVAQTAQNVEAAYGIPAADFLERAKASNYVADYPFLEGAYGDSLEGYLYPKTYNLGENPTVDDIIRALLDQFVLETEGLSLEKGAHGLDMQQIVSLASLVERETAVADERPLVASVIYNRLEKDMPLQIDAAIVYARGGGSQGVTYDDLEIDSPYNVYKNYGLTPGPICSPSVSSIKAALQPADTDYLYYVASAANDGSHKFTDDYDEFLAYRDEYSGS